MMKKYYYVWILSILFLGVNNSYSQIPNASFEEWDTFPFINPTNWSTFNFIVVGVKQSNDAQDGSYSARMEFADFAGTRYEPVLQNTGFTNPIESRFSSLNLYYKSELLNFARFEVFVTTWDTNTTTQQLLPSGSGDVAISNSSSNWSSLEVPIEYYSTEGLPKYVYIAIALTDSANENDLSALGSYVQIDNLTLNQLTDVEMVDNIPTQFSLKQNYPNPFNPSTTVEYSIKENSNVTLKMYDILGNEVAELVNQNQSAGNYRVNFDGSHLSTGSYFVRLQAGEFSEVRKMILMK